jgi:hypothetical protein
MDINNHESALFKRVSWGAIFGGVLVSLSVELVFLTFGLFIGFTFTGGAAEDWTIAWYLISVFCSLFIGSLVAARLSGNPTRGNGALHGFVVWGLTMFTTAVIAAILLWDALRVATTFVTNGVMTTPAAPNGAEAANVSQLAANAAHDISITSLIIFGGLVLAMIGSFIGGGWAAPRDVHFIGHHLPEQPHHA